MALQEIKAGIEIFRFINQSIRWVAEKKPFRLAREKAILQLKDVKRVCGKQIHVVEEDYFNEDISNILFCVSSDRIVAIWASKLCLVKFESSSKEEQMRLLHMIKEQSFNDFPATLPSMTETFSINREIHHMNTRIATEEQVLAGIIRKVKDMTKNMANEKVSYVFNASEEFGEIRDRCSSVKSEPFAMELWVEDYTTFKENFERSIRYVDDKHGYVDDREIGLTLESLLAAQAFNGARELSWLVRCPRGYHRRLINLIDAQVCFNPITDKFLIIVKEGGLLLRGPHIMGTFSKIAACDIKCAIIRRVIEHSRKDDDERMLDEFHERKALEQVDLFNEEVSALYDFVVLSGVLCDERSIWKGSAYKCLTCMSSYPVSEKKKGSFEIKWYGTFPVVLEPLVPEFTSKRNKRQGHYEELKRKAMSIQKKCGANFRDRFYSLNICNQLVEGGDGLLFAEVRKDALSTIFYDSELSAEIVDFRRALLDSDSNIKVSGRTSVSRIIKVR